MTPLASLFPLPNPFALLYMDGTLRHDIVLLRLVRALRVFRVIRLATLIPGFDKILAACTYPARILASVFVLLALGVYVFANIGVALFSSADLEVYSEHREPNPLE